MNFPSSSMASDLETEKLKELFGLLMEDVASRFRFFFSKKSQINYRPATCKQFSLISIVKQMKKLS